MVRIVSVALAAVVAWDCCAIALAYCAAWLLNPA